MSEINITFGTPANPKFKWFDSFEGLTDKELDEIVVHCRSATAAFFAELSDRRKLWKDCTLEGYYDILLENANQINRKGFTKEHARQLNDLYIFLADSDNAQTERNESKVARHFLWLVSRVIDWSYALLILCTLGKHKVQKLDEDQRVKLIKYITKHRGTLFCPRLKDKAIQCNLHQIHIKVDPPLTKGCKKRKRNDGVDAALNRRASGLASQGENLTHNTASKRFLGRNGALSTATATANTDPISNADIEPPRNTLLSISSQPSPRSLAIISEQAEGNGQIKSSTFGIEEHPPMPLAHLGFSARAGIDVTAALSLEANFNRNSIPICLRPYGSPIFMHVLNGDICAVYDIFIRGEGSLWDHDPYGLGLLYYAAHYCWKGSGQECAMAMYSALLQSGAQDDESFWRTDEIGNRPIETINDWLLASQVRGQSAGMDNQVFEEHKSNRGFTKLHKILLKIDSEYSSMADYLTSLKTEELMSMIDIPDSLGRTPLAWAVEYGLTASIELLLTFGADPNQLRLTKDGGFSPLIHLAIAGPRSAWMDVDIVETVRLLILAGANLNGTDHEGWTPLHIAASWSLFSITDMLWQCGQGFLNWQARTVTGESIFDVCDNIDYQNRYWGMLEGPMRLI